jgi:hypothetical protein
LREEATAFGLKVVEEELSSSVAILAWQKIKTSLKW